MLKGMALSTVGALNTTDVYSMEARGFQALRLEAYPGMGSGDLAFLHHVVHMPLILLLSRTILPDVTNAEWNSTGSAFTDLCDRWQQEVRTVLQNTAGSEVIDYCEIWNEPNGNRGAAGDTGLLPWNFAHLYRAAHDVLVHEFPKTKIISGGLFSHTDSGASYLHAVRKVFPIQFDYVGYHPYLDISSSLQPAILTNFIDELHQGFGKPVFITETGYSVHQLSPDLQAANIHSLIDTCRQNGNVEGVLIFTLDDEPQANLYYGVRNRPAWWGFPTY